MPSEKNAIDNPIPLKAARAYTTAGISVIPLNPAGDKKPHWEMLPLLEVNGETKRRWFPFKKAIAAAADLERWFRPERPCAIGVVGGVVSGNLECLDFDWEAATLYPEWRSLVEEHEPGLLDRLTIHATPKGFHVWYRCQGVIIPGNTDLAMDPQRVKEEQTLIETRGEGGYAGCPGSPPPRSGSAPQWNHLSGPKLSKVTCLTPEERDCLLSAARAFDRRPRKATRVASESLARESLPIDDFLTRGPTVLDLLGPEWPVLGTRGAVLHLERPNRGKGSTSATLGFKNDRFGHPMLYLFSSNAAPLPARRFLDAFGVFTWLRHNGDLKAAVRDIAGQGFGEAVAREEKEKDKEPKGPKLIEVILNADPTLFITPKQECYATVRVQGCTYHWEIGSKNFQNWCADKFFQTTGQGCTDNALKESARILECKARASEEVFEVNIRTARHEGNVYVDLANKRGQCLEIDAEDWRVLPEAPVKFSRAKSMFALATPTRGGSLDQLRELLNLEGEVSWLLLGAFMGYCWYGTGEYPVLVLGGEQGTAKSTTSETIKRLVDPNEGSELEVPEKGEDIMIAARAGLLLTLDNVSSLNQSQSDAICRLSTGGGFVKRELYSNGEVFTFRIARPVLLTGITDVAVSGDLIDRSITAKLLVIPPKRRMTKEQFKNRLAKAEGEIVGALASAVSKAMAKLPAVKLDEYPRMADFALFMEAFWQGQGLAPGTATAALQENRANSNAAALENSPVAGTLLDYIRSEGNFYGTSSDLLQRLDAFATESIRRNRAWPKAPCHLTRQLDRLSPDLRRAGIEYGRGLEGGRNPSRYLSIVNKENVAPFAPFAPSPEPKPGHTQCLLPPGVEESFAPSAPFAPEADNATEGEKDGDITPTHRLDTGAENADY